MKYLIIVFSILIFIILLNKYRLRLINFLPIILLYWDCVAVLFNNPADFIYSRNTLFLILFFVSLRSTNGKYVNFGSIFYLFIIILIVHPVVIGDLNKGVREFSQMFASIILLPISYNYYKTNSNLNTLSKSGFWFIILWAIYVVISTYFRLGGEQSERHGTFFYYGGFAYYGGLTYIVFALFLIPLFYKNLKKSEKYLLIITISFIIITLLGALKRFSVVALIIGYFYYLFRQDFKNKVKIILFLVLIFSPFIFFYDNISTMVKTRYYERGELKFQTEFIVKDTRLLEMPYLIKDFKKRNLTSILLGYEPGTTRIEVGDIEERQVHNTYVTIVLSYGIIGLLIYLGIFFQLYKKFRKYKIVVKTSQHLKDYSLVFINLFFIFVLEGIVGGHSHVTLSGIVFIYCGAILGAFRYYYGQKVQKVQ